MVEHLPRAGLGAERLGVSFHPHCSPAEGAWLGWVAMVSPVCVTLTIRSSQITSAESMKAPCWWIALPLILVRPCVSFCCLLEGPRAASCSCCSHLPTHVSYVDTRPLSAPHSHPQGFYLLSVVLGLSPLEASYAMEKKIFFAQLEVEGAKSSFLLCHMAPRSSWLWLRDTRP